MSQLLSSLREDVKGWEQEYLSQALALGRAAFKPHLDAANDLWVGCVRRWGQGSGYRDDIAGEVQGWFDDEPSLNSARQSVESGLTQLWKELVLDSLTQATRFEDQIAEDA
ncbi:hypothetical protein [Bosea vaviloviae]|uniref:Phasin domain-containing protein n=1 Tax=Bosea vaviloviae TaxID=1526658 RepID=A0A1D7UC65_9HYPH|nr:hypothetical protein [Bosea vaviloviae]AOO84965.1 hypothetical protein BHK69_30025 [Bosea vaviloviae]